MNAENGQNLAKKATALFSAIAASSFLGLPALAQVSPGTSSQYSRTECVPASVNQSGLSTPGAADNNIQPQTNQADPRTVTPDQSMETGDATSQSEQRDARNVDPNQAPQSGAITSGDVPFGDRNTGNQTDQTTVTPVAPAGQTSQSGAGGDSSMQTSSDYSRTQTPVSSAGTYSSGSYSNVLYDNVTGRGGATAGGFARQLVESASNPERQPDEFANQVRYRDSDNSEYQARNYGQSQTSDSQIQTSGVTSGGEAVNQPVTTSSEVSDSAMQSSQQMTGSRTIASCPPGMVPRQSMQNQQQTPSESTPDVRTNPDDSNVPGRALPNVQQTPDTSR